MKPEWEARFVHQLCRIKGQASLRYNLSAQIVGSFILFIKQASEGDSERVREIERERGHPTVLATMFCSTVAHTANRGRRCNVATLPAACQCQALPRLPTPHRLRACNLPQFRVLIWRWAQLKLRPPIRVATAAVGPLPSFRAGCLRVPSSPKWVFRVLATL